MAHGKRRRPRRWRLTGKCRRRGGAAGTLRPSTPPGSAASAGCTLQQDIRRGGARVHQRCTREHSRHEELRPRRQKPSPIAQRCPAWHRAPPPAAASKSWCPRRGAHSGSNGRWASLCSWGDDTRWQREWEREEWDGVGAAAKQQRLLHRAYNARSASCAAPSPAHLLAVRHVYHFILQPLQQCKRGSQRTQGGRGLRCPASAPTGSSLYAPSHSGAPPQPPAPLPAPRRRRPPGCTRRAANLESLHAAPSGGTESWAPACSLGRCPSRRATPSSRGSARACLWGGTGGGSQVPQGHSWGSSWAG